MECVQEGRTVTGPVVTECLEIVPSASTAPGPPVLKRRGERIKEYLSTPFQLSILIGTNPSARPHEMSVYSAY